MVKQGNERLAGSGQLACPSVLLRPGLFVLVAEAVVIILVKGGGHGAGNIQHQHQVELFAAEISGLDPGAQPHGKIVFGLAGYGIIGHGRGIARAKERVAGALPTCVEEVVVKKAFVGNV